MFYYNIIGISPQTYRCITIVSPQHRHNVIMVLSYYYNNITIAYHCIFAILPQCCCNFTITSSKFYHRKSPIINAKILLPSYQYAIPMTLALYCYSNHVVLSQSDRSRITRAHTPGPARARTPRPAQGHPKYWDCFAEI